MYTLQALVLAADFTPLVIDSVLLATRRLCVGSRTKTQSRAVRRTTSQYGVGSYNRGNTEDAESLMQLCQ